MNLEHAKVAVERARKKGEALCKIETRKDAVRAKIKVEVELLEEHAEWHRYKKLQGELSSLESEAAYVGWTLDDSYAPAILEEFEEREARKDDGDEKTAN